MLEVTDVEIDARVVIPCPEKGFKPRRAAIACPQCPYFNGVAVIGEEGEWHQKYVIRCAHVIERRTQLIEEVIEE